MVGYLKDFIYRKQVDSTIHRMKIFDAYGIDKKIVGQLKDLKCTEIRILEKDTGIVYSTSFQNFLDKGIEKNFDGMQIFLPIKHFTVSNNRQKSLLGDDQ